MSDKKLLYMASDLAIWDTYVYCRSVRYGDGTERRRTAWQEGWNAYGSYIADTRLEFYKWLTNCPEWLLTAVEQERVKLYYDEEEREVKSVVDCSGIYIDGYVDEENITEEEYDSLLEEISADSEYGYDMWCIKKRKNDPVNSFTSKYYEELPKSFKMKVTDYFKEFNNEI